MTCARDLLGNCGCGCDQVGGSVGAVSLEEADELDNAVSIMNADVNASVTFAFENCVETDILGFCHDAGFDARRNFQETWTDFAGRWHEWFSDHQTSLSRLGVDPEFAEFRGEYNRKRESFLQMGEQTNAPNVAGKNPLETAFGTVGQIGQAALIGGALLLIAYVAHTAYQVTR